MFQRALQRALQYVPTLVGYLLHDPSSERIRIHEQAFTAPVLPILFSPILSLPQASRPSSLSSTTTQLDMHVHNSELYKLRDRPSGSGKALAPNKESKVSDEGEPPGAVEVAWHGKTQYVPFVPIRYPRGSPRGSSPF